MQKSEAKAPEKNNSNITATKSEIDYSPKQYSLRQKIVFGVKTAAILCIVSVLLWMLSKV